MRLGLPSRLSWKLLAAIIPVVILAVSGIVWLQYHMARREILAAINKEALSLAQRISTNIDDLLDQRQRDLLTLAETPQISDYYHNIDFGLLDEAEAYRKELYQYFKRFSERNLVYARIVFVDQNGLVVSLYDARSAQATRVQAMGREFISAKEARPGNWLASSVEDLAGVGPVIYYAKPIFDEHKEFKGVLTLCYDLTQMRSLLGNIVVGRRGRAYVQVEEGRSLEGRALAGAGLELLTVSSAVKNRPWTVVVEAPLDDFLGPLRTVRDAALLTLFMGLAGLVVLILFLVRSITRPISVLVAAAGKIGSGDFSQRIPDWGGDELGTLSRAFNEMSEHLEQNRRQNTDLQSQLIQAEKLSAVGQLISAVAHELNNPLGAISGYVQLALHDACLPQLRADLGHVYSNVLRCRKVVENLLFFVRKSNKARKRVELNAAVQSALELLEYRLLKTENVRVEQSLADPGPVIIGDYQQIVQVLVNLINNACDAMEATVRYPEGKLVKIVTGLNGRETFLRVEDNGPGVPADIEAKLFQAFFTTKEPGRGTGLGLSICRQIVADHGGKISMENRVGHGCAFILDIPMGSEDELQSLEALEAGVAAEGCAAVPGKRILVVDDEKDIADLVARLLRDDGDEVRVVYSGAEALALIGEGGYDLVITDMEMEDAKGSDLYGKLMQPGGTAKILFMTGDILNHKVLNFLTRTQSPYVVKPFDIEDLRQAARRLLAARV